MPAGVPAAPSAVRDTDGFVVTSWGSVMWVEPTFRTGEYFEGLPNAFDSDEAAVTVLEYHMAEDFVRHRLAFAVVGFLLGVVLQVCI